ncbi:MAG: histidine kinase N-terminal 7TM domain-containing diguanylate cyclase [Armatimonadota bacterium]
MSDLGIIYISLLMISTITALVLAGISWQRRLHPGAVPMSFLSLAIGIISISSAFESITPTLAGKEFWVNVQYIGYSLSPVFYILTVMQYLGNSSLILTRRNMLLLIVPILTILFAWTNDFHHLMRNNLYLELVGDLGFLGKTAGIWWGIHASYSLVLMTISIFALFTAYLHSPQTNRRHMQLLLIGLFIPVINTLLYVINISPFPDLDLTPVLAAFSIFLIGFSVLRLQLFEITPIAYAHVIDSMSDGILVLNQHHNVVYINAACAKYFSLDLHTSSGHHVNRVFNNHPELIQHLIGDFQNKNIEFTLPREDGNHYWELHLSPLYNKHVFLIGCVALFREITQRKMADEALLIRTAAIESSITGFSVTDLEGHLIYMNPAAIIIWRDTPEEAQGKNLSDYFQSPDDITSMINELKTTGHWTGEQTGKRNDGSTVLLEVAASLVVDQYGKPMCMQASFVDITSRKQAQDAIIKSRDYYLQLFEAFPALIWRSGIDSKRDYFNKTWLDFTGRTFEQEIGDGWADNIHQDDIAKCINTYLSASTRCDIFDIEYRLRRADGEYRWIADYGRPFYDINGIFSGYIGSCYDITERKQHTEQLDYLAMHDALTGLPNRRVLEETINRVIARAKRGIPSVLLFVDLDYFKEINDTQGHQAGDQILIMVSHRIKQALRDADLLVRLGGDEFAILMEGINVESAIIAAKRVLMDVDKYDFTLNDNHYHLSLSIGIRIIDGRENPVRVLSQADTAMYQAKNMGRNQFVVFQPAVHDTNTSE